MGEKTEIKSPMQNVADEIKKRLDLIKAKEKERIKEKINKETKK